MPRVAHTAPFCADCWCPQAPGHDESEIAGNIKRLTDYYREHIEPDVQSRVKQCSSDAGPKYHAPGNQVGPRARQSRHHDGPARCMSLRAPAARRPTSSTRTSC